MYQVSISKEALKELRQLPKQSVIVIHKSIDNLSQEPRPVGCKKLKGTKESLWRIRVGNYRIIYSVDDIIRIVEVRDIGHRKNIYE